MKISPSSWIIGKSIKAIGLALAVSAFFTTGSARAAINIPSLTWTQRSDWLNVKSSPFNAVGDGVADDTAAIQAALTLSATCNSGGTANGYARTVYLPPGTYKISSTLTWKGTNTPWTYGGFGLQLIGCGRDTVITWSGTSGGAMFLSQGATGVNYIGLTWDGKNLAGAAYLHSPTYTNEDPVRHENEAFYNFTATATYISGTTYPPSAIMSGLKSSTCFDADVLVWNCLFSNCANGIFVGYEVYNDYQWCIEGCEFDNCGTGVTSYDGKMVVFDCHFQASTVADIYTNPSLSESVRSCTSQGSKTFYKIPQSAAYGPQKVQDCWVDSWTSTTGALDLGNCGPTLVSDCVFTNPPNTAPPIRLNNNSYGAADLLISNNYCPPSCTGLVSSTTNSKTVSVPPGSLGGTIATLSSGSAVFLQSTWPADSANIIDVTGTAYGADKTGVVDATAAIQNAINTAKAANNWPIVYLPVGTYNISSTITMSGSNYSVQGAGLATKLSWSGTSNGTVIAVTSPCSLSLEQMNVACPTTAVAIKQTGTSGGDMIYDGLNHGLVNNIHDYTGLGIQLISLPAGSRVFLQHVLSPLTVSDCGPAEIFGQYLENGRFTVNGATQAKTGFLGVSNSMQGGSDGTNYDILVDDNQDLVIGHMYNEGSKNHLKANRGAGTWSGRITIQGVKQNVQSGTCTSILVNNYQGRVLYGPTNFANSAATLITQTGTNLVDLILPGVMFNTCAPTLTTATSCNFIQTQNIYGTAPVTYPADVIPTGGMASIAAGFDHLRQLWAEDLKLIHGIQNVAINSFFETDPINPSPLTTMGTTPASWVVSGGTATGAGVRNMSVVAPGSPFSSGTQCASFVDTTGTSTGSRLAFVQTPVLLPASSPAVFSFDVRLNSMASLNDDVYVRLWSGSITAHNIHLTASSTGGYYGPAPLALDTWYRIRAVIQAPSLGGTKTITLYVTPWNGTAPGTTTVYSGITGSTGSATTGFTSIYFNQTNPGANTNINFDNITLVSGDPLLPH